MGDTSTAAEYAGTAAAAADADRATAQDTETGQAETPPDPRGGGQPDRAAGRRTPQGRAGRGRGGRLARGERWFDQTAREAGRISLSPPRRITARDTSGFAFGLLLYILALNYVRHGPDGVKGWLGAKFLNKPWTPDDVDQQRKAGGSGGPPQVGVGGTARAEPAGLATTRPARPAAV